MIDTGDEINAVHKNLADSLCIGITATNESAKAANQLPLEVCGQSKKPVEIECLTEMGPITLYLGIVLVITNLGTSCLIGEPGKKRNNIVCLPRHKLVVFASGDNVRYVPYDEDTAKYSLLRAVENLTFTPGSSMQYQLPKHMQNEAYISVIPRPISISWLEPSMIQPSDGKLSLVNSSNIPVVVRKGDHLADARDTTIAEVKIATPPSVVKA